MKCPNDQTEMKQGVLASDGRIWYSQESFLGKLMFPRAKTVAGDWVYAYKCPKCSKVELYAETKA